MRSPTKPTNGRNDRKTTNRQQACAIQSRQAKASHAAQAEAIQAAQAKTTQGQQAKASKAQARSLSTDTPLPRGLVSQLSGADAANEEPCIASLMFNCVVEDSRDTLSSRPIHELVDYAYTLR